MKNSIDNGRRRFVLGALTSSAAAALTNVSPLWAAPVGRHFKDQVLTGDIKNLKRDSGQYLWNFNGEFWADELGDYVFSLKSSCS